LNSQSSYQLPTSFIRNPELLFIHWNIPVLGIQYSMEKETCNCRQGHNHNIELKIVRREEFHLSLSSPQTKISHPRQGSEKEAYFQSKKPHNSCPRKKIFTIFTIKNISEYLSIGT